MQSDDQVGNSIHPTGEGEAAPAPDHSGEPTGRTRSRWVVVLIVAAVVAYPIARWMTTGSAASAPDTSVTALQSSLEHYNAGRYDDAVEAAKAAIAANPKSVGAYNNLAVSYLALHKFDEGIEAAQNALRLQPDYQLAKNNLAWIQREKEKASQPAIPQERIQQARTLLNGSLQHAQAQRFGECVDAASQAVKINPSLAAAFNNLGYCSWKLRRLDDAIRFTEEAIRLDSNLQIAKNNLTAMKQEKAKGSASKGL